MVALASYLPLSGSTFGVEGDGLIPVDTALMEGGLRGPAVLGEHLLSLSLITCIYIYIHIDICTIITYIHIHMYIHDIPTLS